MDETKKTAGQIILEHDAQRLDLEDDLIEYRKQMEPDVAKKVYDAAENARTHDLYKNNDFYVVLTITNDRVLRVPKPLAWARRSCPTPVYKQSVWKYMNGTSDLEFLWSIPDKVLYYYILQNQMQFLADPETKDLAKFVILMESGELLEWVKKENGEKKDGIIKIVTEDKAYA